MDHIGRETFVEVGNSKYKLSRYTRELDAEFVKWALSQLPDPIEEAKKDVKGFAPELQAIIVREAIETKRKRDAGVSEEVAEMRGSQRGMWKVLCLLFQKHHPELTERDVGNIFDECHEQHGPQYLAEKLEEASGVVKKKDLPEDGEDGKKKEMT